MTLNDFRSLPLHYDNSAGSMVKLSGELLSEEWNVIITGGSMKNRYVALADVLSLLEEKSERVLNGPPLNPT